MLRAYIIGLSILFIAIICNIIAEKIGLFTWYFFGSQFFKQGFGILKEVGLASGIWLFILYPLILTLGYLIEDKIFKLF